MKNNTDQACTLVLQDKILVFKLFAIDALASSTVRILEISTLMKKQEVGRSDDRLAQYLGS